MRPMPAREVGRQKPVPPNHQRTQLGLSHVGADLSRCILHGAHTRHANLTDANLTGAKGLDLSEDAA